MNYVKKRRILFFIPSALLTIFLFQNCGSSENGSNSQALSGQSGGANSSSRDFFNPPEEKGPAAVDVNSDIVTEADFELAYFCEVTPGGDFEKFYFANYQGRWILVVVVDDQTAYSQDWDQTQFYVHVDRDLRENIVIDGISLHKNFFGSFEAGRLPVTDIRVTYSSEGKEEQWIFNCERQALSAQVQ